MSQKYLPSFVQYLEGIVNQLNAKFPTEKDLSMVQSGISGLKLAKQYNTIASKYRETIYPYSEQIEKRDEKYFLETDFSNGDKEISFKADHIKQLLNTGELSDDDKSAIWKTLILLNRLMTKMIESGEI